MMVPPVIARYDNKRNENVVLYVKLEDGNNFDIRHVDIYQEDDSSQKKIVPKKEIISLFDDPNFHLSFKAVIFNDFDADYPDYSYSNNIEFRHAMVGILKKFKTPFHFIHSEVLMLTSGLIMANIDSKPSETVLIFSFQSDMIITVHELYRKPEGYEVTAQRVVEYFDRTSADVIRTEILGQCDPKSIIAINMDGEYDTTSKLLKSLQTLAFQFKIINNISGYFYESLMVYANMMLDPMDNKYYILPKLCFRPPPKLCSCLCEAIFFAVTIQPSFIYPPKNAIISSGTFETLPFEKSKIIPKSKDSYYMLCLNVKTRKYEILEKLEPLKEKRKHRVKLSLVVDEHGCPILSQEAFIITQIKSFPSSLMTKYYHLDVPIIGFFDNSSIICVRNENGYGFLDSWNGLYGHDLFLSFKEGEKPTLITDINNVNCKDTCVVYDLLKILSMPSDNIEIDPVWGFEVYKNEEKQILIRFDGFEGKRRYTPVFLMAMLLKHHHFKAIKKETGKLPTKIGFCIFDKVTSKEKRKRVVKGLDEACKSLNVESVMIEKF